MVAHIPHEKQFRPNNWQLKIDWKWKTGVFAGHTERSEFDESFYKHFRKIGTRVAEGLILIKSI
jgi:hypothetical protein